MADVEKPKVLDDLKNTQMSVLIANALDSAAAHTSFGRLALGDERSAPVYGFGTSTREQGQKQFLSEELTSGIEKASPGPKYLVQGNANFSDPQNYSFGKDERITMGRKRTYDHYDIKDTVTNPIKSKQYVLKDHGTTKFGTGSRNTQGIVTASPGPQYLPPHRQDVQASPRYTLGSRRVRHGSNALEVLVSTPALVGPGRYAPERAMYTSVHENPRTWSVPKKERTTIEVRSFSKHQTYDTNNVSCGPQCVSRRKTAPSVGFGTATREQVKRLGIFKETMSTQPAQVRIPLPAHF